MATAFKNEEEMCPCGLLSSAATAAFFLLFFASAALADYEAGRSAWDAGRRLEALAQWRAAANEGDAKAMAALGQLYAKGVGVPQNFVQAHMWFNLAASRGVDEAAKERDALAAKMTPQQIAMAQERALSWRPGMVEGREPGGGSRMAAGSPPPRAIREAQGLLGKLGYDPGPADGVWGGRSAKAYGSFLRDAGMVQSETLTPEGLRALRSAAGRSEPAPKTGTVEGSEPRQAVVPEPPPIPPDALHRAVLMGNIEGVEAVLNAGIDVDGRDGRGWTALMHAANKGYSLLVERLLEAKADTDVRGPDGATALFMAVAQGNTEIVVLLMKAGADISIRGPQGRTAVDVARARYGGSASGQKNEDPAVVALLEGKTWAEAVEEVRVFAERLKELESRNWPAGESFRECRGCPEMVVMPAGEYMMGWSDDEEDDKSIRNLWQYARPQHRVTIRRRFAVGKYEVTRSEYERFVKESGRSTADRCWTYEAGEWKERGGRDWSNPGFSQGEREPVVCVSWEDAQAYVDWLRAKTGKEYRLLSEAEWEYVARGGTTGRYHFGEGISPGLANYGESRGKTVQVGSFPANDFGLHDTHGNVWEWVEDCWHKNYSGAPSDGRAWTSGGDCSRRVLRGGSWYNGPGDLRSAYRGGVGAGFRGFNYGFRVARTLAP